MPLSEAEARELAELEARRPQQGGATKPSFSLPMVQTPLGMIAQVAGESLASGNAKMGELAYQGGDKVREWLQNAGATPEQSALGGYAANVGIQAVPTFAGGLLTKALMARPMEAGARTLMQSALKPGLKDLQTGKAARAIDTLLKEGIQPSKGGVAKLREMTAELDKEVNALVAASSGEASTARIGSALRDTWNRFRSQVNPDADLQTIRAAWNEFIKHPDIAGRAKIPVQLAQELKRGTYARLQNRAYGEVGSASQEAQKALARGARQEVGRVVPETEPLLARQSELMNAAKIAERRALQEGSKNPAGIGLLAENPATFLSFMADRSAAVKALLARALYSGRGAIPENLARAAIAGSLSQTATKE